MRVGSLFSGIGGMDLGLERAGMTIAWQVEIDEFCLKVLKKHWPEVPKYGDIKKINPKELEPVELVAGGPPCQPVSVAGKKRGTRDERWLWPEMAELFPFCFLDGSSWRTLQVCLNGGLETFSETWPRSGMMRNGKCYPRRPLVPATKERGSLLLPTPQARDWKGAGRQSWSLPRLLREIHGKSCYPSPQLYEAVMMFPVMWTELEV